MSVDWQVHSLIVFGPHDVSQRPPFPNVDLVRCSNLGILRGPPPAAGPAMGGGR